MTMPHAYDKDPNGFWLCRCGLPKQNRVHGGLMAYTGPVDPSEVADVVDSQVIDQAIREVAGGAVSFSANEVRPLLPRVKSSLIGQRFQSLIKAGEIVKTTRRVPSTDPGTHGHEIAVYTRGPMLRAKGKANV